MCDTPLWYTHTVSLSLSFVLKELKDNLRLILFQIIIRICFYLLQVVGFDIAKYPNVSKWLEKAKKTIPKYEELNHAGCLKFKEMYESTFGNK